MANIAIIRPSSTPIDLGSMRLSQRLSTSPKKRLIFPPAQQILEPPNLKATLANNLERIPLGSSALDKKSKKLENGWNHRFSFTFSKDNPTYPTKLREYFDSPKSFEPDPKDFFNANFSFNSTGSNMHKKSSSISSSDRKTTKELIQRRKHRRGFTISNSQDDWKSLSVHNADRNSARYKTFRVYFDEIQKLK